MIEFELRPITPSTDFSDLPLRVHILPNPPTMGGRAPGEFFLAVGSSDEKVVTANLGDFLVVPRAITGNERKRSKPAQVGYFAVIREDAEAFKTLPVEQQEATQAESIATQPTQSEFLQKLCRLRSEYESLDSIHPVDRVERPELCAVAESEKHAEDGFKPISDYLRERKQIREAIDLERKKLSELELPPAQKALISALLQFKAEALLSSDADKDVKQWAESAPEALRGLIESKAADNIKAQKEAQAKAEAVRAEKQKQFEEAREAQARADKKQRAAEQARISAANAKREAQAAQELLK